MIWLQRKPCCIRIYLLGWAEIIVFVSHNIAFSCEYSKTTFLKISCCGVEAMKLASAMCMWCLLFPDLVLKNILWAVQTNAWIMCGNTKVYLKWSSLAWIVQAFHISELYKFSFIQFPEPTSQSCSISTTLWMRSRHFCIMSQIWGFICCNN